MIQIVVRNVCAKYELKILTGFQICDLIAVTWPFQKNVSFFLNFCGILKSAEKTTSQPVLDTCAYIADYNAPFDAALVHFSEGNYEVFVYMLHEKIQWHQDFMAQ